VKCSKKNLCFVFFLVLMNAVFAHQIRVGYFLYDGYQNLINGEFSGYGYEYLREIQKYNDWQYDFISSVDERDETGSLTGRQIPLSYDLALKMLEKGELDIVGSVRKSPQREKDFLFPRFGCGIAYEMLTSCSQEKEFIQGDYCIGLRTGSIREAEFTKIYREAGFGNVSFRYFDHNDDMVKALLETKEIDFILSSSLRKTDNENLVYKYNPATHYFIFNKQRFDLLEEFNDAHSELLLQKTTFAEALYAKYYKGTKNSSLWISEKEQKYIMENPIVQVVHDSSWFPIDYADEQGNPKGIIVDIFHLLEEDTGLRFNFISGANYVSTLNLFNDHPSSILAIFANDYAWAEKKGIKMTSPYINLPMSVITSQRFDNISDPTLTVAAVEGYYFTYRYLTAYTNVLLVENVGACLEAVRTKKADITFIATYSAERMLKNPKYSQLFYNTLADMNYNVCIGMHENVDPVLYQILNKAVNNLFQVEIDQCVYDNTLYYTEPETFFYFAEKYGEAIIAALILSLVVVIFIVYLFMLNTRRKKSNEKLALANRKLQKAFSFAEQANRAKTEFLSRVSHDIRTPMNIITGMTDIALDNLNNSSVVKDSLNKILNASDFLLKLINDVLDMSRIETGKMIISRDFFNVSEIVKHLTVFFENKMKEKGLYFSIDTSLVVHDCAGGDAVHIEQVLMNLLSNALKYTHRGSVELVIKEVERDASFSLFTFTVRDTGIGIKIESLSKIWEPFEKEREDGSSVSFGLGLAIVKSLVNLMGGTVSAESTEGEGSSFTVILPLEVRKNEIHNSVVVEVEEEKKTYEFNNECVLIVEDNELNMEIAQVMLSAQKIRSEAAMNGSDAVMKFSNSAPDYYSAILMDIRMPVMDGREATRIIRSLNRADAKTIPIIAMSADAFTEEIKISQSAGMNEYITKPIRRQELYRVLDKWINLKGK